MNNPSNAPNNQPLVPVGSHCILELYECPNHLLNDFEFISQALVEAVKEAKSTLLKEVTHQFEPYGITALALLAESHISVHTWPEIGYVAIDMFTCGEHAQPEKACNYLTKAFQANKHVLLTLPRGRISPEIQKGLEESLMATQA
ncbi:adenosylmethionine decarboxylase [Mastigocoleus sp. MO_188.B34]|uniref:adenosylmethionine decarboxylase n=1 Tax=Mastigocoleus sp. MO_188.B34 TaxID=3036635 RepID=UPI00260B383E|nr:adenosylmethionine decarboxylase [Mastigocoleus sp. MO_188.B34]MDJ0696585.1 adenosylmethionine decarboxylase [Mastigocoleus sp. MO_188.B34]